MLMPTYLLPSSPCPGPAQLHAGGRLPGVPVHAVPTPHAVARSGHTCPHGSGHPDGVQVAKIVSPVSGAGTTILGCPLCLPIPPALPSSSPLGFPSPCFLAILQIARATGVADEALGNVRTVRAFAMEQREEE